MTEQITRRSFFKTVGSATAVPVALGTPLLAIADATAMEPGDARAPPAAAAATSAPAPAAADTEAPLYLFFNAEEAAFIEAACERLIPADETGPGALEAWVPNYLDKQLGGAWGAGERLYRSGPWQAGTPSQGYQLPFTPAELFHTALRAINLHFASTGKTFAQGTAEEQDAYLKSLETGGADLDGVPSGVFFDSLLKMTIEGYFSDPVYGGNRNMAAWKMIGFPGAYANYYDAIDRHGVKFERAPMSIGEDRHGHVHVDPNIPASL
ncbi:MAG TPA: gluconate 2-dehydrogenase subunit 3 family protein [Steroidobacteraceae bacterium]|nr:gluconate 2-dehydrogenase subunit 3 family protein [Steroidobacteraceae bacterium]